MFDSYFDRLPRQQSDNIPREVLSLAYIHKKKVIIAACVIANLVLVAGWFWPKMYTSHATIIFEDKNIIKPLLEGSAVPTDISARAETARELMFSRTILNEVTEVGGWLTGSNSMIEREKRHEKLRRRINVRPIGANLIRIEFKDGSPETSLAIADFLSETFVEKSQEMQIEESHTAFEFIDAQVKEYREKLLAAEQALMKYNSENLSARPSEEFDIGFKISDLEMQIEETQVRLAEIARTRSALKKQLDTEGDMVASLDRERRYREQLAEANKKLADLRLLYRDSYPDIVQLLDQIQDLELKIGLEQASRGGAGSAAEDVYYDPKTGQTVSLYQQLRREYAVADTEYNALRARLREQRRQMESGIKRGVQINESAAMLSELTRDYEVNKSIHEDLLRRRENARVSMKLDENKQGLSIRIYEKAFLPLKPSGLRFLHFAVLGVLLGAAIPALALYTFYATSKRIRSPARIEQLFDLPMVATIPRMRLDEENQAERRLMIFTIMFAILAAMTYLGLGVLRLLNIGTEWTL